MSDGLPNIFDILFCFAFFFYWDTPSNALGLLPMLCLGTTPGSVWGIICGSGNELRLTVCKEKCLTYMLCFLSSPWLDIFLMGITRSFHLGTDTNKCTILLLNIYPFKNLSHIWHFPSQISPYLLLLVFGGLTPRSVFKGCLLPTEFSGCAVQES